MTVVTAHAYDLAAAWHDKQAAGCRKIADDEPRIGADIRAKARTAATHHAASAAGLRLAAINLRRASLAISAPESDNLPEYMDQDRAASTADAAYQSRKEAA